MCFVVPVVSFRHGPVASFRHLTVVAEPVSINLGYIPLMSELKDLVKSAAIVCALPSCFEVW